MRKQNRSVQDLYVRLVSYNIRKAVGLDWRRDPNRILEVLAEVDADIVVLQEADRRMGNRAGVLPLDRVEALGYELAEVSIRPQSHGWHGNVILSRVAIMETHRIPIPAIEPRGAIAAEIAGLTVIGTHLGLTPGVRRRQLAALCDVVEGATLIAGDFNEWNKLRVTTGEVITPGPSFHAARPRACLDRFISFGVDVKNAYVHHSDRARQASDHLPVVLEFEEPKT